MFSKFFNPAGKKSPTAKAVGATPGMEVKEDDPEALWSEWDSVLAELDFSVGGARELPTEPTPIRPNLDSLSDFDAPTQPMSLDDTRERDKNHALAIVETHHPRVAHTIRTMWGYKECSAYIDRLIMNGGDGMGESRVGFNTEAVESMLRLTTLHDERFGNFAGKDDPTHGDFNVRNAFDGRI